MQNNAGVFRTGELLEEGIKALGTLSKDINYLKVRDTPTHYLTTPIH